MFMKSVMFMKRKRDKILRRTRSFENGKNIILKESFNYHIFQDKYREHILPLLPFWHYFSVMMKFPVSVSFCKGEVPLFFVEYNSSDITPLKTL